MPTDCLATLPCLPALPPPPPLQSPYECSYDTKRLRVTESGGGGGGGALLELACPGLAVRRRDVPTLQQQTAAAEEERGDKPARVSKQGGPPGGGCLLPCKGSQLLPATAGHLLSPPAPASSPQTRRTFSLRTAS